MEIQEQRRGGRSVREPNEEDSIEGELGGEVTARSYGAAKVKKQNTHGCKRARC